MVVSGPQRRHLAEAKWLSYLAQAKWLRTKKLLYKLLLILDAVGQRPGEFLPSAFFLLFLLSSSYCFFLFPSSFFFFLLPSSFFFLFLLSSSDFFLLSVLLSSSVFFLLFTLALLTQASLVDPCKYDVRAGLGPVLDRAQGPGPGPLF